MTIEVDDTLLMVISPGRVTWAEVYPATAKEVTPTEVICDVMVDVLRTMTFERRTGWRVDREAFLIRTPREQRSADVST